MITESEFYSVSDNAHFLGASTVVYGSVLLGGSHALLWAAIVVVIFAGIKEGLWDPKHETPAVAGSGWRDFFGYMAGLAVSLLTIYIKAKLT